MQKEVSAVTKPASAHARKQLKTYPFETLVQTVTARRTCRLDVPLPVSQRVKAQSIGKLASVHGVGQILDGTVISTLFLHKVSAVGSPACWRTRATRHPSVHLHPTFVELNASLLVTRPPGTPMCLILTLLSGLRHSVPIVGVDDEDDTLGVLEVCAAEQMSANRTRNPEDDIQCLHNGRILSCPPTSHTVNEMFLYSTVSTLKPK